MREEIIKILKEYESDFDAIGRAITEYFYDDIAKDIESKLKNLGEGEAGTGYALLSDVADRIDNIIKFIAVSNTNVIHWHSISDTPIGAMRSVKHDLYEELGDSHNFDANEWKVIKIKIEIMK